MAVDPEFYELVSASLSTWILPLNILISLFNFSRHSKKFSLVAWSEFRQEVNLLKNSPESLTFSFGLLNELNSKLCLYWSVNIWLWTCSSLVFRKLAIVAFSTNNFCFPDSMPSDLHLFAYSSLIWRINSKWMDCVFLNLC